MNFVKNPTSVQNKFPKIQDGSKIASVGTQYNDTVLITVLPGQKLRVTSHPFFLSQGSYNLTDPNDNTKWQNARGPVIDLNHTLVPVDTDWKIRLDHDNDEMFPPPLPISQDIPVECWRVLSQQVIITPVNNSLSNHVTWKSARVFTNDCSIQLVYQDDREITPAWEGLYWDINENSPSYNSGQASNLLGVFFQNNLNYNYWPWKCLCDSAGPRPEGPGVVDPPITEPEPPLLCRNIQQMQDYLDPLRLVMFDGPSGLVMDWDDELMQLAISIALAQPTTGLMNETIPVTLSTEIEGLNGTFLPQMNYHRVSVARLPNTTDPYTARTVWEALGNVTQRGYDGILPSWPFDLLATSDGLSQAAMGAANIGNIWVIVTNLSSDYTTIPSETMEQNLCDGTALPTPPTQTTPNELCLVEKTDQQLLEFKTSAAITDHLWFARFAYKQALDLYYARVNGATAPYSTDDIHATYTAYGGNMQVGVQNSSMFIKFTDDGSEMDNTKFGSLTTTNFKSSDGGVTYNTTASPYPNNYVKVFAGDVGFALGTYQPYINNTATPYILDQTCPLEDTPPLAPPKEGIQLTPTYRQGNIGGIEDINTATTAAMAVTSVTDHSPSGIGWIPPQQWVDAEWDGVTTVSATTNTRQELCAFIFPTANTMRGLKQLFETVQPFADATNPTVSEIEDWNIEVIRLLRRMFGYNQTTHPVQKSRALFLRSQWTVERKTSTVWDASYPGTLDSAFGRCTMPIGSGTNEHCGATFIPDAIDQLPYLNTDEDPVVFQTGAEGTTSINTDIPWSIKLARTISGWLCGEGVNGHFGPYLTRPEFGYTFNIDPINASNSQFTGKWIGTAAAL